MLLDVINEHLLHHLNIMQETGGDLCCLVHVHQYEGVTTCQDGHSHILSGINGPAVYLPNGTHVHLVQGRTTFHEDHYHEYCVYSGADIEIPGCYTLHPISFQTSVDDGHCHSFKGYDQASIYEKMMY